MTPHDEDCKCPECPGFTTFTDWIEKELDEIHFIVFAPLGISKEKVQKRMDELMIKDLPKHQIGQVFIGVN